MEALEVAKAELAQFQLGGQRTDDSVARRRRAALDGAENPFRLLPRKRQGQ